MVVVSHKNKLVWYKVYKNAHSSILKWLKHNDPNLEEYEENRCPEYLSFIVFRDPIERFMSAFIDKFVNKYIKQDWHKKYSGSIFLKQIGIKKKVPDVCLSDIVDAINTKNMVDCDPHFKMQSSYITNVDIKQIKYILNTKNLDEELNTMVKSGDMSSFTSLFYDNRKTFIDIDDFNLAYMTVKQIAEKYGCLPSKNSFLTDKEITGKLERVFKKDYELI